MKIDECRIILFGGEIAGRRKNNQSLTFNKINAKTVQVMTVNRGANCGEI